jgi:cytoskeletal protein CcmA (bactofilin family)
VDGEAVCRSEVSYSARFQEIWEGRGGSNVWQGQGQLAPKGRTFTAGDAVADPCEFGRVRFDGYLLHRSRHDSCRKISSEGTLNVFGRVEGELHASIVRISDGAQVEGVIAAQDLTIGGHFKGTIQANRVTLTCSAVVEGEIHHRSLAIEENAWFAGVSHPEEASASGATDSPSSIQLVPTDGDRLINSSLEKEVHADTASTPPP